MFLCIFYTFLFIFFYSKGDSSKAKEKTWFGVPITSLKEF